MSSFYHSAFTLDQDVLIDSDLSTCNTYDASLSGSLQINPEAQGTEINNEQMVEKAAPNVPKKRRPAGNEQVKHRRTRNGCYTCRSRRVKCDEQHPKCERCQKGNRECSYPEPRQTLRPSCATTREQLQQDVLEYRSSSDDDAVVDAGSQRYSAKQSRKRPDRQVSASRKSHLTCEEQGDQIEFPQPSIEQVKSEDSRSPSTDLPSTPASAGFGQASKFSSVSTDASQELKSWAHLPPDLQLYLEYHQRNLNYHHYFFKHDANHFLHISLIEHALLYEPLLYAVVGFAAFHMTVKRANSRIESFLGLYNKSVSLLRRSLAQGQKHTDATVLTILQLAAFEEYLGDYVSLLGHQQAAYRMLLELYTPQSINETEVRRKIIVWYSRFDLTGGLMSGNETALGREWFFSVEKYYRQQSLSYPTSLDYKIEAAVAKHRLVCTDMALMFAKHSRGAISPSQLRKDSLAFSEYMKTWHDNLDPIFRDEQYRVTSFDGRVKDPNDIVDPFEVGGLSRDPLFTYNFMLIDWHAISVMFKYKMAVSLQQPPPEDLGALALEMCRLFEAIELWPESPSGSILKAQAALGIASLFLPKDERHSMWCRRKLAKVESLGHIYPPALRRKMAEHWEIPEIDHWWLPNEEAYPPVIRSIRSLMENRLPQAASPSRSEDQRNIAGIFSSLTVHDSVTNSTTVESNTDLLLDGTIESVQD